mgnify:CR=1 FL=1
MFQNVNSQQLSSVDNHVLSGGITQYMEDGYSYNDAVQEILKTEEKIQYNIFTNRKEPINTRKAIIHC